MRCSSRGPEFVSQQPHDGPQLSITPVPGDLTFSSGLHGHCKWFRQSPFLFTWGQMHPHERKITPMKGLAEVETLNLSIFGDKVEACKDKNT